MPTVIMPKMGDAMEEGTLLRWLKQQGDEVAAGEPIAEIETDKVTLEIEAAEGGVLSRTLVAEGAVVPIGTAIATIGEDDAPVVAQAEIENSPGETPYETSGAPEGVAAATDPAASNSNGRTEVASPTVQPAASNGAGAAASAPAAAGSDGAAGGADGAAAAVSPTGGERLRASPLVKRLAAEHGIDLSQVPGTGPGGRIVKDDIQPFLTGARPLPAAAQAAAAPTAAAPTQVETVPPVAQPAAAPAAAAASAPVGRPAATVSDLSRIKRTTGKRMLESKLSAPHFYVTIDVDMEAAVAFREQANAASPNDVRVSFNDLVIKAAALALREFPNLNASFENDQIHSHPNIDVNVAVALPEGLIAPFIPDADQKSLGAISRMSRDLIGRARDGGLQPNEYQGGTFTVSNLGMYEVDEFISIINPPQAAILAVGSIADVPVVKDGAVVPGKRMKLTLSADHRVTDGAEVARSLQAVRRFLENPMLLALG
jgi:pyruvate dehydrogenase E2 component (dihydrolipoamide acetyltransferase)